MTVDVITTESDDSVLFESRAKGEAGYLPPERHQERLTARACATLTPAAR